MRFVLDTNIWIFYLKSSSSPVGSRLKSTPVSEIVTCSIVWAELLHGARKYEKRADRVARVERTLAPFVSLPFDNDAARHYAEIRDDLESQGQVIGSNDLMIAAIARSVGAALATRNTTDFERCGIKIINPWL